MELFEHRCTRCGGELTPTTKGHWVCRYCACTFDDDTAKKDLETMKQLLDENKREIVSNLRRNLYDAVNAEYISSVEIQNICTQLKKHLPDDFRANFYSVAAGSNNHRIAKYIRNIDVEGNYEHIGDAVIFLIRSLQPEYLLELNDLVERAYKYRDLTSFEKYATEISKEAERVQSGVYETKLPREVFVAYSSKDMDKVMDLVECLESQGLKCFVAARNLRHGRGAVENYDKAIKEAIEHCRSFVFVSSSNSRSLSCDALEIELSYVRRVDIEAAPSEFKNDYASIPHKYKKPRVEYRVEESRRFNAADEIVNEFFDGYERVYSPDEVATRIVRQLIAGRADNSGATSKDASAGAKKYCVACGYENESSTKFCSQCGKSEFAASVSELLKKRESAQSNEKAQTKDEAETKQNTEKTASGNITADIKTLAKDIESKATKGFEELLKNAERKINNAGVNTQQAQKPAAKKFCIACCYYCDASSKFCAKCGGNEFAADSTELRRIRENRRQSASYTQTNTAKATPQNPYTNVATEQNEKKTDRVIDFKSVFKNLISYEVSFFNKSTTRGQKLVHFSALSLVLSFALTFILLGIESESDFGMILDVLGGFSVILLIACIPFIVVASVIRAVEKSRIKKEGIELPETFRPRIVLVIVARVLIVIASIFYMTALMDGNAGAEYLLRGFGHINILWAFISMIYACCPKEYNKIKYVKFIPQANRSNIALVGGIITLNIFVLNLLTCL